MKRMVISMALLVLIGAPTAIAQSSSKGSSVGTTINGGVPQAPVGHRQPRPSDFGPNAGGPNGPPSTLKEDRNALDSDINDARMNRILNGICRGC